MTIFIFIGGQSGVGKSTLSTVLSDEFKIRGKSCQLIKMDDYFHEIPEGMALTTYQTTTNFDTPEMLYLDELVNHLKALNNGEAIDKPIFDFTTSLRKKEQERINASDIIIVDGIFALEFVNRHILNSELKYVPVLVTAESYQQIVAQRIHRNKTYGMSEDWLGRVLNLKPLIEHICRFVNSFCSSLSQSSILI